jgi:hypothetical protein
MDNGKTARMPTALALSVGLGQKTQNDKGVVDEENCCGY